MDHTRITINGRTYESAEAMPPDVRRAYQDVMRRVGPALRDGNGNGIPDVVEGTAAPGAHGRIVVENRIDVNGATYGSVDEMPPDVRRLYDDAMGRVRRGPGFAITREGPTFSIGFSAGSGPTSLPGVDPAVPRAIGASATQSGLRTFLVLLVVAVVAALSAWALLGR